MEDGMEFSLPAWIGGLAGTVIAVAIYLPGIRMVEQHLRAAAGSQALDQRAAFEAKLSVVRRLILGAGIAILAALGYWIGTIAGGKWAA
jgi:hypothetical protein